MKIKETIYTEIDYRGRVIKRTRTVETYESDTDRGYDYGTTCCGYGSPRQSSFDRIYEAYDDYRKSREW
jgi:hypothetical protein